MERFNAASFKPLESKAAASPEAPSVLLEHVGNVSCVVHRQTHTNQHINPRASEPLNSLNNGGFIYSFVDSTQG